MKILKVLFSLIAIVVALIIVAVIAIPQLVDPNDYKDQISGLVKEHTGRDLSIDGDLSLSVFPWVGVTTGKVVLSQPASIQQSTPNAGAFVAVEAVDVKVKLKPLFSRKLEVDTILLKQPRIELVTDKKGNSSLDGLSSPNAEKSTETAPADAPSDAQALAGLAIAGVDITGGHIIIDDQPNKARHELKDLSITSGDILSGKPVPLSVSAQAISADLAPIALKLDTQISLDQDTIKVSLSDLALSVTQEANQLKANIQAMDYSHPNALATITAGELNGSANGIPFSLSLPEVMVDNNKPMLHIPKLSAESLGISLTGKLKAKDWDKNPTVLGNIQSSSFNAKPLLKKFDVDYQPTSAKVLEKISFGSHFTATPKGVSLQKTTVVLDQSTLEGSVAVVNFDKPRYRFDLSLDSIVVDDYLPVSDETQTQSTPQEISATEALAAPIGLLKEIYANGVFRAKKITANKLVVENVNVDVKSTASKVSIKPKLDLYQGKLDGTIELTKKAASTLSVVTQLKQVNLEPLLTDAEITDQFSGIGNVSTNLVVTDNKGQKSSKGTIKLLAKDGAIKGVDIKKILDDAQATIDKLRGKASAPSTASEDSTRFAEMSATLLLNNDVITNNDLSIKAPVFRIKGEGSVDLAKQTLDYLTSIVVVNTNSGQGGKSSDDLKGITLPVRFSGSLTAPKYKLDTRALIKANTAKKVNEEKEKLKDKLKDKLLKNIGGSSASSDKPSSNNTQSQPQEEPQSAEDALKEKLKNSLLKKLF